jgi:hypothetical protein
MRPILRWLRPTTSPARWLAWAGALSGSLLGAPNWGQEPANSGPPAESLGFLVRTNYRGWADSILVSNGQVEAVIVPAIGRVMQFRWAGEADGPFWENEALFGKAPDAQATNWFNFGGDKTWPAPQAQWPKVTPREWPPPATFDAVPVEAKVEGWDLTLITPVDPHYGIRARRHIGLAPGEPAMTITTTYEKVKGRTLDVAICVITQLKDPLAVYAPVPQPSLFLEGYSAQSEKRPANLEVRPGLLSLTRDPKESHKIGLDSGTLIWLGTKDLLRIDSARLPLGHYPDRGSSAEIYTSPDPLPYVELEMLSPLARMRVGDQITRTSTYRLQRRIELDPNLEIRQLLAD